MAPASAYAVVECYERKLLAAEMTLCGREAPAGYTCELAGGRVTAVQAATWRSSRSAAPVAAA